MLIRINQLEIKPGIALIGSTIAFAPAILRFLSVPGDDGPDVCLQVHIPFSRKG